MQFYHFLRKESTYLRCPWRNFELELLDLLLQLIFRPSLEDYDVTILLHERFNPRRHQAIDSTKHYSYQLKPSSTISLPVINFDPSQCYFDELKVRMNVDYLNTHISYFLVVFVDHKRGVQFSIILLNFLKVLQWLLWELTGKEKLIYTVFLSSTFYQTSYLPANLL